MKIAINVFEYPVGILWRNNRGSLRRTFGIARIGLEGFTQEIINARNIPLHPDTLPPMDARCERCLLRCGLGRSLLEAVVLQFSQFCCGNGKIRIPTSTAPPASLLNLLLSDSEEAKTFRNKIRLYNSVFAFSSIGVRLDGKSCECYCWCLYIYHQRHDPL